MKTPISEAAAMKKRLADATTSVQQEISGMRARIEALRQELKRVKGAPLPRGDVTERIRERVRADGARWLREHGRALIMGKGGLASPATKASQMRFRDDGKDLMTWAAFSAAFPDRAVEMLEALVARVEYEAGPSLAERPALLEQIADELGTLEGEEEESVDNAAAAGVMIEHRPEVVDRRAQEARQRQRAQEIAAATNRGARQALLDQVHAAGTTAGVSEYLKNGKVDREAIDRRL